MKHFSWITLVVTLFLMVGSVRAQSQGDREFDMRWNDTTYVMKKYFFCMLKSAVVVPMPDTLALSQLQVGHLNHIFKLLKAGKIVMVGPMDDEGILSGIMVFDVATEEEAIKLESTDPMVSAGLLKTEFHPWWTVKGSCLK